MTDPRQNTDSTSFDAYSDEVEEAGLPSFLRDPRGVLTRRWPWMLLATVLVASLSVAILVHKGPRYEAQATILIATQRISESFVRSIVREDLLPRINSMMSSVLSRQKLAQIVVKHNPYPGLRESHTLTERVDTVRSNLSISLESNINERSRQSNARLLRITFEASDPRTAANVVNEVAGLLTAESIRIRSEQVGSTLNFLSGELKLAEAELHTHKQLITAFRVNHRGELPSDLSINLADIERLRVRRRVALSEIAESEMQIRSIGSIEIDRQPTPRERELAALQATLRSELALHTSKHPNVEMIDRQVRALEDEIERTASEAPLVFSNRVDPQIARLNQMIANLRAEVTEIGKTAEERDAMLARIPMRQEALSALEARRAVLDAKYTQLLVKVEDAEISRDLEMAQQGEQVSILDLAEPPTTPKRTRLQLAIATVAASLAFAICVGVLFEVMDPVIVDGNHLKDIVSVPYMGSAPVIS